MKYQGEWRTIIGIVGDVHTERLTTEFQPAIYTPFLPAEGSEESQDTLRAANNAVARDQWDARVTREAHFRQLLHDRLPNAEIKDLSPTLTTLRSIKSPREIALIRRASQIAGLALMEAMRSTRPGVREYELDAAARYVFLVNGARGGPVRMRCRSTEGNTVRTAWVTI